VKEILTELERVPIIRNVCVKMGIDHSTFYRWMTRYPEFWKSVTNALWLGRKRMNDAAESVIINGIQNQSIRAATYWLSHNDERFMGLERGKQFERMESKTNYFMSNKAEPKEYPFTFEKMFEVYEYYEEHMEVDEAKERVRPMIEILFREDAKLVDLFYASYEEWKKEKIKWRAKAKETGVTDEQLDGFDEDEEEEP
jgi:hypothetical protein